MLMNFSLITKECYAAKIFLSKKCVYFINKIIKTRVYKYGFKNKINNVNLIILIT